MELITLFFLSNIEEIKRILLPRLWGSFVLVILFTLAVCGCQQSAGRKADLAPPSGAALFKEKCSTCHDTESIMQKYRSAETWRNTITRMKVEHNAGISEEEMKLLVRYHVDRQQQEAAIFNEKCQQCHPGKVFLEKDLSEDQARAIIRRMQRKAGNTIEDEDVEIIVRYHVQAQQAALEKSLNIVYDTVFSNQPGRKRETALFLEKCSACHEPTRALEVKKSPELWAQTIKRMQSYSKGAISDLEARELVDFHVAQQQREINTFKETCTQCHDDERINSRSMSEEQWIETIRRMQQKAPELISDEKVNLLAAYFHRRELTMARIFYGKCRLCHLGKGSGQSTGFGSTPQMDGLIFLAKEEFGGDLQISDVNNLRSLHIQRQKGVMRLYESNCGACHSGPLPEKGAASRESPEKRTRAEWISLIAMLQGVELSKEIQNTINSQIDYHVSKH